MQKKAHAPIMTHITYIGYFDWYRFNEKLVYAQDKDASRINMQTQQTGNNFWNIGHSTTATFGLRSHSEYQPKVKVAPFTRLN